MLSTIKYIEMNKTWSVIDYLNNNLINNDYPKVQLKKLIFRNRDKIELKDGVLYSRVKIKWNNEGLELRDSVFNSKIKEKVHTIISTGQLLISKIDARNGAVGIVSKEFNGFITTNEFLSFNIDENKINIDFLKKYITTDSFKNHLKESSIGHTFLRLNVKTFLDIDIALPDIKIQNEIMFEINKIDKELKELKKEKEIEEKKFEETFFGGR